jgi:hypothetical protein
VEHPCFNNQIETLPPRFCKRLVESSSLHRDRTTSGLPAGVRGCRQNACTFQRTHAQKSPWPVPWAFADSSLGPRVTRRPLLRARSSPRSSLLRLP